MRVLRREEPDRVPHFEWAFDSRVRAALCPDSTDANDFAVRMGHDAVLGLANEQEVNGRAALSAKAAWLYEYEGPGARGEGRGKIEMVAKAVDKLSAIYWQ